MPDRRDVRLVVVDGNNDIDNHKASPSRYEKYARHAYFAPWGKIMNCPALQSGATHPRIPINRPIVVKNNIRFDEITEHEDVTFSYLIAFYLSKIKADDRALYARRSSLAYSGFASTRRLEHTGASGQYKKRLKDKNINLNETAYTCHLPRFFLYEHEKYKEAAKRSTALGCSNAIYLSLKPIIGLVCFWGCGAGVSKYAVYRDVMRIVIVNTKRWLWKQAAIIQ
jgi:hypothetical protein